MTHAHRIGYVGNFTRPWCTEVHVQTALESLGHQVVRYQENEVDWTRLAGRTVADGIELLLWTRTWPSPLGDGVAALNALRVNGIPSVAFHLDRWWGLVREHQVRDEPMFRCDLVVTADGGHADRWEAAGVNHLWMPPAVLGAEARMPGRLDSEFDKKVAFVGSWQQYHKEWYYRTELIAKLRSWYMHGTRHDLGLWPQNGQPIRGQRLNDLYATAGVIVGDSCLASDAHHYWSDRIPETLGRGGFLIHPNVVGLDEHFTPGEHLATYDLGDWAALRNLIDAYIADPAERARIATAGRAHVLANHTYENRMQDLIDHLHDTGLLHRPDNPTVGRRAYFDAYGGTARFNLRKDTDDALVINETWRLNTYRLHPSDVAGRTVIDAGANVGAFAVWAAHHGAVVVAVEPDPDNVAALRSNLALNAIGGVRVVEAAATGSTRRAMFVPDGAQGRLASISESQFGAIAVDTVTIDHLLRTWAPDGGAVVKLDIEGGEYELLGGLREWELVDVIVMEFHGPGMCPTLALDHPWDESWGEMVTLLAEHGAVEIIGRPSVGGQITWRRTR